MPGNKQKTISKNLINVVLLTDVREQNKWVKYFAADGKDLNPSTPIVFRDGFKLSVCRSNVPAVLNDIAGKKNKNQLILIAPGFEEKYGASQLEDFMKKNPHLNIVTINTLKKEEADLNLGDIFYENDQAIMAELIKEVIANSPLTLPEKTKENPIFKTTVKAKVAYDPRPPVNNEMDDKGRMRQVLISIRDDYKGPLKDKGGKRIQHSEAKKFKLRKINQYIDKLEMNQIGAIEAMTNVADLYRCHTINSWFGHTQDPKSMRAMNRVLSNSNNSWVKKNLGINPEFFTVSLGGKYWGTNKKKAQNKLLTANLGDKDLMTNIQPLYKNKTEGFKVDTNSFIKPKTEINKLSSQHQTESKEIILNKTHMKTSLGTITEVENEHILSSSDYEEVGYHEHLTQHEENKFTFGPSNSCDITCS